MLRRARLKPDLLSSAFLPQSVVRTTMSPALSPFVTLGFGNTTQEHSAARHEISVADLIDQVVGDFDWGHLVAMDAGRDNEGRHIPGWRAHWLDDERAGVDHERAGSTLQYGLSQRIGRVRKLKAMIEENRLKIVHGMRR